jgi:hypothetical protein
MIFARYPSFRELITFILAFSAIAVHAQEVGTTGVDSASTLAMLEVAAPFEGLPVFLDKKKIGQTPLRACSIAPGRHELDVQSPYWPAWNQPSYQTNFTASPGEKYQFVASFQENILINSIPPEAKVFLNGSLVGETPTIIARDTLVTQLLVLQLEGYQTFSQELSKINKQAWMINLQEKTKSLQEKEIDIAERKKTLRHRKRMMFVSMGLAAVSGWATIHFRAKGNDEYARYQSTALPAQMDYYFNRAKKSDRLAGATFVSFELGCIMSGYFFLTSRP